LNRKRIASFALKKTSKKGFFSSAKRKNDIVGSYLEKSIAISLRGLHRKVPSRPPGAKKVGGPQLRLKQKKSKQLLEKKVHF